METQAKPEPTRQEILDAVVASISTEADSDVFLYSAGIADSFAGTLIELIRQVPVKRQNAILILTTNGGSADAAYQIARTIKHHYTKLNLYVFGYCKSAGTLIAVAADQIVMSEFGQFGPLDVQLADKSEIFGQTAALDVNQALQTVSEAAFTFFTDHFFRLGPGRGVPTAKAIEMAKVLTLGVIEPIAAQIDPLLLGRVDRSMRIAEEYCTRLNPSFSNIKKLVGGYPSHEFVIDFGEAKSLFANVRHPNESEIELESLLRFFQCVPNQDARSTIMCLSKNHVPDEKPAVQPNSASNGATDHNSANEAPAERKSTPRKAPAAAQQEPAS